MIVGDDFLSLSHALFSIVFVKKVENPPPYCFSDSISLSGGGTGFKGFLKMGFSKDYKV
ncbi:hypothetical protein [Bartonella raoultii]|uniref:hypothetical protein n=1 Tax=Bartonella raoultii TaxID=1457020 RepID=UPI001ABB5BB2|nr:hypothetical protein [Bartonella raoultii]